MAARRLLLALALAAGLGAAPPLTAQKPPAHIRGVVKDTESRPLEGATIEVLGEKIRSQSNADGAFRIDSVPAGRYWLTIRRIGYIPLQLTMTLDPDSTRDLPIEMERKPTRLSEIAVTGDAMSKYRYQDFYWRSKTAFGRFLTRDDLAKTRAFDLIDVVQRYLPGRTRFVLEQRSWFDPSPGLGNVSYAGTGAFGSLNGFGSREPFSNLNCAPATSINGGMPWPGASLADFQLDDVEAVEVYRKSNWVPIGFDVSGRTTGCGLVVLWLK